MGSTDAGRSDSEFRLTTDVANGSQMARQQTSKNGCQQGRPESSATKDPRG